MSDESVKTLNSLESPAEEEEKIEVVIEANELDELTDQQLIDLINEMETEKNHLKLENRLLMEFLNKNEQQPLDTFQAWLDYATGVRRSAPSDLLQISDPALRRSIRLESTLSSLIDASGPKINLSTKTDIVLKAMEEIQSSLNTFVKKCNKNKRHIKAELEEFSIRESDIKEARDVFEFNIVTQGVDKLTQRIPAEKFIKYMDDWLKSAQFNIEKLRLRTGSLKVHFKKVSTILVQRQELGENVHAVDFDQLEIENKHFLEKIEQKSVHLVELKKMNGGANLVLSKHKKYLQKQQHDYSRFKEMVTEKDKVSAATEKECELVEEELDKARERYDNLKKIVDTYRVPDVMEYIKVKSELYELKKNIKIWQRRKNIQDIALNACIRQMKNITGNSTVDPLWLQDPEDDRNNSKFASYSEL